MTLTRPNRLIPPVIYYTSRGIDNKYSFINFCFDLTFDDDRGMAQASSITANRERYLANSGVFRVTDSRLLCREYLHYCALRLWVGILSPLRQDLSSSLSTASHEAPELKLYVFIYLAITEGRKGKPVAGYLTYWWTDREGVMHPPSPRTSLAKFGEITAHPGDRTAEQLMQDGASNLWTTDTQEVSWREWLNNINYYSAEWRVLSEPPVILEAKS